MVRSFYLQQPQAPVVSLPYAGFMPPMPPMFGYSGPPMVPMMLPPEMLDPALLGPQAALEGSPLDSCGPSPALTMHGVGPADYAAVDEVVKDLVNASVAGQGARKPAGGAAKTAAPQGAVKNARVNPAPTGGAYPSSGAKGGAQPANGAKRPAQTGARQTGRHAQEARAAIDTSALNFPPLVAASAHGSGAADAPAGYNRSFIRFSADELVSIVEGVKEALLPASIVPVRALMIALIIALSHYMFMIW